MTLQAKADLRAAALTAGQYDLLLADCAFPLMLFLPGVAPRFIGPQQLERLYHAFRSALPLHQSSRIMARITAQDLPRRGRARLWVDWLADRGPEAPALMARTVCYRRQSDGVSQTEMVEFTHLDVPLPLLA